MSSRTFPSAISILLALGCGGPRSSATQRGHAEHAHGDGHGCHTAEGTAPGHHDDFTDVDCFARLFDAPERDAWQHPDEVVRLLEVSPGMTVVDLGAGTGYFEARLAAVVGEGGSVLALDVEPRMVEHMRVRFEHEGLAHAEPHLVAADDPGLRPESVDRILIVDTWHHLPSREAYAALLASALRPGGAILVVDFTAESPEGPPVAMRITAEAAAAELAVAGLIAEVVEETLPHQWVVRARRASN